MQDLLVETRNEITTLTLNRPKAMNALSRRLRAELLATFERLSSDDSTHVIILTGAGDRAFSAGLDLKELSGLSKETSPRTTDAVGSGQNLMKVMEQCPKPIIAAVNGFAITGGFELALACDVLIGSTNARFADTHARVGILPGWGLSQKLSRLIGISRAKELSLTGNYLDAETACQWGLLNRVVTPDELLGTCEDLARDMQSCRPETLRLYKQVIDRGFAESFSEGLRIESAANREHSSRVTPESVSEVQRRGRAQSKHE
jgi:enoyl-CoA hydratase